MSGLRETLASLAAMDVDALRTVWREYLGEPPPVRSSDVLRRALAEALQTAVAGGSIPLEDLIERAAIRHPAVRMSGKSASMPRRAPPGHPVPAPLPAPVPVTLLTREWQGVCHEVEVRPDGYVWQGRAHKSLSSVARQITGVRWNGPRFFGLRSAAGGVVPPVAATGRTGRAARA